MLGALGIALYYFSMWLDARPVQLFAVYDYWHTSPNFFLARVGILLVLFPLSYVWCRCGSFANSVQPDGADGPDFAAGLLGAH